MALKKLNPLEIEATHATQARVSIRPNMVSEYAADMKRGDIFPPLTVFAEKGSKRYVLADGFHTRLAHIETFQDKPIQCDVREGSIWDAKVYAAGANAVHGERRRNKDIRNAIKMLLLDAKSAGLADSGIADMARCYRETVASVREKMIIDGDLDAEKSQKRTYTKKDGTKVTRTVKPKAEKKVEKKAKAKPKTQDEVDGEQIVEAIKTLTTAVCGGADALSRYGLEAHIADASVAADWLDDLIAEYEEQNTPAKKKQDRELTESERMFLAS